VIELYTYVLTPQNRALYGVTEHEIRSTNLSHSKTFIYIFGYMNMQKKSILKEYRVRLMKEKQF
jgi:hypothetical protein